MSFGIPKKIERLVKVTPGGAQAKVIVDGKISNPFVIGIGVRRPPLWSSGQSCWLQIQRSRVRFPALPDFLSSSGSGTGSTQPREVN